MIAATHKCGCLSNVNLSSPTDCSVPPRRPSKPPPSLHPSPTCNLSTLLPPSSPPACYHPPCLQPQNPPSICTVPTSSQSPRPPLLCPAFSSLQAPQPSSSNPSAPDPSLPITTAPNPSFSNLPAPRPPFSHPPVPPFISKDDDDKCHCPRPRDPGYDEMCGACKPCCQGVFQYSPSKVVSEIAGRGIPYKEIEAIINDNRVVIRMQKEPVEAEWDPPCDCNGENPSIPGRQGYTRRNGIQYDSNVVFQMANTSKLSSIPIEASTGLNEGCDQRSSGCRTITIYPQLDDPPKESEKKTYEEESKKDKKDKMDKPKSLRLIDLEENPNIFLLRIRKRSDNGEKKNTIDLEFRAPRPWRQKPKPKTKLEIQPDPPAENKNEEMKKDGVGKSKKGKKGKK